MSKSWGPGYFRSELFSPPPGFKAMKEWNFELRKKGSRITETEHLESKDVLLAKKKISCLNKFSAQ